MGVKNWNPRPCPNSPSPALLLAQIHLLLHSCLNIFIQCAIMKVYNPPIEIPGQAKLYRGVGFGRKQISEVACSTPQMDICCVVVVLFLCNFSVLLCYVVQFFDHFLGHFGVSFVSNLVCLLHVCDMIWFIYVYFFCVFFLVYFWARGPLWGHFCAVFALSLVYFCVAFCVFVFFKVFSCCNFAFLVLWYLIFFNVIFAWHQQGFCAFRGRSCATTRWLLNQHPLKRGHLLTKALAGFWAVCSTTGWKKAASRPLEVG